MLHLWRPNNSAINMSLFNIKTTISLFLVILFTSCTNHSDDGLYVGSVSMGSNTGIVAQGHKPIIITRAWIINGDLITICELGDYRQVKLLRASEDLGMGPNVIGPNDGIFSNTLGRIEYDSNNNKCIKILFGSTLVLKKVAEKTDMSPAEVIEKYKIFDIQTLKRGTN